MEEIIHNPDIKQKKRIDSQGKTRWQIAFLGLFFGFIFHYFAGSLLATIGLISSLVSLGKISANIILHFRKKDIVSGVIDWLLVVIMFLFLLIIYAIVGLFTVSTIQVLSQ